MHDVCLWQTQPKAGLFLLKSENLCLCEFYGLFNYNYRQLEFPARCKIENRHTLIAHLVSCKLALQLLFVRTVGRLFGINNSSAGTFL